MTDILYAAHGGTAASSLYTLDPGTGAETAIGPTGYALTGLAVDPTSGVLYGASSAQSPIHQIALITLDTSTGAATFIGTFPPGDAITDICFDASGQLYGWKQRARLAVIDKATAGVTVLPDTGLTSFGNGLDFSPLDGLLYVFPRGGTESSCTGSYNDLGSYYTLDTSTGVATVVGCQSGGPVSDGSPVAAGSFYSDGVFWAIWSEFGNPCYLVKTDVSTGVATTVATLSGTNWDALAWTPPAATAPLAASFTATPLSGSVPFVVSFTDTSTGSPATWAWDFGDGGTDTAQNPTHTYTVHGAYDVTLTVTD